MNDRPSIHGIQEGEYWVRIRPVLQVLIEASEFASSAGIDNWEFAAELEELLAMGVSMTDLRWLAWTGIVDHAVEVTQPGDHRRRFERCENLGFGSRTSFILTEQGTLSFRTRQSWERLNGASKPVLNQDFSPNPQSVSLHVDKGEFMSVRPTWDPKKRVLLFDGKIIKQFKWPAANQELVVNSFHEQGWPEMIHDPIPQDQRVNPKTRLHDTIKCLNRNHRNKLIRFHGNGSGTGVVWRPVKRGNANAV